MSVFRHSKKQILVWSFASVVIFCALAVPPMLLEMQGTVQVKASIGAAKEDQDRHHLPQIRYFVEHPFNFAPYPSTTATTPGHHILLSYVSRLFAHGQANAEVVALRVAHFLFSILLMHTAWWLLYVGSRADPARATLLLLPVMSSPYLLNGALFITTDNAALALACAALLSLVAGRPERPKLSLAGIMAALAICWRQTYAWLLLPIAIRSMTLWSSARARRQSLVAVAAPLVAGAVAVAAWGGLTPPEFRAVHSKGLNTASLVYVTALSGLIGLFFIGYVGCAVVKLGKRAFFRLATLGVLLGVALWISVPSTYDWDGGRWGGVLWTLAARSPAVWDRSLVFIVLLPVGMTTLIVWARVTWSDRTIVLLAALAAFAMASTTNHLVFHRYYEPFLLLFFAALASQNSDVPRRAHWGPLLLAIGLYGLFITQFSRPMP